VRPAAVESVGRPKRSGVIVVVTALASVAERIALVAKS